MIITKIGDALVFVEFGNKQNNFFFYGQGQRKNSNYYALAQFYYDLDTRFVKKKFANMYEVCMYVFNLFFFL